MPDDIARGLEQFVVDSTVLALLDPDSDRDVVVGQDHRIFEFNVAKAHGIPVKKFPVNPPGEFDVKGSRQNYHVVKTVIGEVGQ